jgi:LPXTG-motif cell wall-anchored protein
MMIDTLSRRRRVAAVAALATLAMSMTVSGPAAAAEDDPLTYGLSVHTDQRHQLAPEHGGAVGVDVGGRSNSYLEVHDIVVTVDTADVASFATVTIDPPEANRPDTKPGEQSCRQVAAVFTCRLPVRGRSWHGTRIPLLKWTAKQISGAAAGPGTIKVSATFAEHPSMLVADTSMVFRETVKVVSESAEAVHVQPGAEFAVPVHLRAVVRPVRGAFLRVDAPGPLQYTGGDFSNCGVEGWVHSTIVSCTFDAILVPGKDYALSAPLTFRTPVPVDAAAPLDDVRVSCNRYATPFTAGSNPLHLVERGTGAAAATGDVVDQVWAEPTPFRRIAIDAPSVTPQPTVDPTTAPSTGTPSVGPSAGSPSAVPSTVASSSAPATGGAGDAGSLPRTGTNLIGVVGGGLVVVLLGVAGYVFARRRRTRFVA